MSGIRCRAVSVPASVQRAEADKLCLVAVALIERVTRGYEKVRL